MDQALAEALLDDLMADSLAILSLEEGFGNMAKEQKQHEERGEKEQGEGMEQSNNEQKQSKGGGSRGYGELEKPTHDESLLQR